MVLVFEEYFNLAHLINGTLPHNFMYIVSIIHSTSTNFDHHTGLSSTAFS